MRTSLKLSEFINSKYHKETLDYLCGINICHLNKEFLDFERTLEYVKRQPFDYLLGIGKNEMYNFIMSKFPLVEDIRVDFEDFSIYIPKEIPVPALQEFESIPKRPIFISVKKVWLPRKRSITVRYYEELGFRDTTLGCTYIFKKSILPKNRKDLYKYLAFLRYKKRLLFPPDHKRKWCPGFWTSVGRIKLHEYDSGNYYGRKVYMNLPKESLNEFLRWQDNRYTITK